jgi:hypothetical protein
MMRPFSEASNWVWLMIVLALAGLVVWGWAFDFAV